ncbi:MAG: anthranilate phosphoribosyltransferase [Proteobacteria bacterium]|nr:anthranilate phosphoribosyltransferase [Pseudomonadota bacterium]
MEEPQNTVLHRAIQKVATGPEYSKDLEYEEALETMEFILSGEADPVQIGIFLIALRMKRETNEENCGILQAIKNIAPKVVADIPNLIDLSDPYDGYIRGIPASPFLPAVFAAAGYPCVSHGVARVGPKFGVTHRRILSAAGKQCDLSISEVKGNLENENPGWSYLDQATYCPPLHQLNELRQRMVKRQIITTVEVLAQPIRANGKTHMMSGYVHKVYPSIYANLARHAGYDSMVLIRGVEGGVIPSLKQPGRFFSYADMGEESATELDPVSTGLTHPTRNVPLPEQLADIEQNNSEERLEELAAVAAKYGLEALQGVPGGTRDSLVYSGAIMLHFLQQTSLADAADRIRTLLDSGAALEKFNQHQ